MTFQVKLSESEVKAIIAAHLSEKLNLPVTAEDLTSETYSCALTLGKYDSFHVPPKPKKVPEPVAVAAEPELKVFSNEETKTADQPF